MKQWIEKLFKKANEPTHLKSGRWGEKLAAQFLKKKRYKIIGQRVRVGKRDEIDIIAEHGGALIFVEVKTRKNENHGRPFSAVDKAKRKRHLSKAQKSRTGIYPVRCHRSDWRTGRRHPGTPPH